MSIRNGCIAKKWSNSWSLAPEDQKGGKANVMIDTNACSIKNEWMELIAIADKSKAQTVEILQLRLSDTD